MMHFVFFDKLYFLINLVDQVGQFLSIFINQS